MTPVHPKGQLGRTTIALLTITSEEFDIVREVFRLAHNIPGSPYFVSEIRNGGDYDVVLRSAAAQTNMIAAESVGIFIEEFRPAFTIMIGTAGGHSARDGVSLGDVVVAEYLEYSGYWKYKENQILRRKFPHDHPSMFLLTNFLQPLKVMPERWRPQIGLDRPGGAGETKIVQGEIVSGDLLYGDPDNPEQKRILDYFDKALAFEMEGVGLARTIFKSRQSVHYNPQFVVIRGISDLVNIDSADNNATRKKWTPYAIRCAATVARELSTALLSHLDSSSKSEGTVIGLIRRIINV